MTTIVTRVAKGSPLTHVEVDTNFTNLNTAKLENLVAAAGAGTAAAPSISFAADTNTGLFNPAADTLAASTAGVERARFDSSGRLLVGTTTAAATGGVLQLASGITFPATAVAATDANTLDDYEEGTWTALLQEYPAGSTLSTTGRYTKIGRCVHLQVAFVNVNLSAFSGNDAYLTGTPFASGAETIGSLMTDSFTFNATGTSLSSWIEPASTQINFYASQTNAAKKSVRISPGAGRSLWLNLVYTV